MAHATLSTKEYVESREYRALVDHNTFLEMRKRQKQGLYRLGYQWGAEEEGMILCLSMGVWPYRWKEYGK